MGEIIELERMDNFTAMLSRLKVYYRLIESMKPEIKSINKELSEEIANVKPERRSMQLGQCFSKVMTQFPPGTTVKDIDVLFNPNYKVDVLQLLVEENKRKQFKVVWPGRYENGKLIYAEEGYIDYKVFEIKKYDITCII